LEKRNNEMAVFFGVNAGAKKAFLTHSNTTAGQGLCMGD